MSHHHRTIATIALSALILAMLLLAPATFGLGSVAEAFNQWPQRAVLAGSPALASPNPAGTPQPALHISLPSTTSGPDLTIESITLDPPNPAPGQLTSVTIVVKNIGNQNVVDGFYTYLYIDPPQRPPTATTPDTNYVGWFLGLNQGATFTWSYRDFTFDESGCNHVIYAWVDRNNMVAEANEDNNLRSLAVCVGSVTGDPYEPDDTCQDAAALPTNGTVQDHNFSPPAEEDWTVFEAVGGVEYLIGAENVGASARAALNLYPRCGMPASFGSSQEIPFTAPTTGLYYIRAVNHDPNATGDTSYRISITRPFDCSGYFEPNDSRAQAKDILVDGAAQQHSFCAPNDEDWVRFPVRAGVAYTVRATGTGANAAPALVGSYGDGTGPSTSGNPLQFTSATDGTYYVRAMNTPPSAYGTTAMYNLSVSSTGCTGDEFEPDNTRADARQMTINGSIQVHNVCPAGDRDWVKFQAAAGQTYTVETVGVGLMSDTIICLYDNIGTQIVCDDEGGANHGSRITRQLTAGGLYFVEVRHADEHVAGPATAYEISIVTGLCKADIYEPDNSPADAKVLYLDGSRQARSFCVGDDRDWLRIQVPAAGTYTILTESLAPGSDTYVTLRDGNGAAFLAENDDFGPGRASQVTYNFTQAGIYFAEIRHFNPVRYGRGTSYIVKGIAGAPTPTATAPPGTPTPTPTATPTPPPSGIQTLILTNRERLTTQYGAGQTAPLFDRLVQFANHPSVQGEVIAVDDNNAVASAYAAWIGDLASVARANQVASAVRSLAMDYLAAHPTVRYIVLVGDDRVVPSRRVVDRTHFPESEYTSVGTNSPVGAALAQDTFLTDDYYADREPSTWEGAELYIPDYAVGRLIETPQQIGSLIDSFLVADQLAPGKALVVGYDFVQDVAANVCDLMGQDLGNANLDCTLIGDTWTASQFRDRQLSANPPFKLQSTNIHASHASQGAPVGGQVTVHDIVASPINLSGALIYSVGCHSGLNVPEMASFPLDLPEAFARKQVNYVGNTGFGWGNRVGVQLSERLMQTYTEELLRGSSATVGGALRAAKQRYYQESDLFGELDEKVLQQATLYGFPMLRILTGAVLGDEDPFPSATIISPFGLVGKQGVEPAPELIPPAAGTAGWGSVTIEIGASAAQSEDADAQPSGFAGVTTDWGSYYRLDGHVSTLSGGPIQPRIYARLIPPDDQQLRGVVFTGGTFSTEAIDPVINAAINEYVTVTEEPSFQSADFFPPIPFILRGTTPISRTDRALTVVLGQYYSEDGAQRLYDRVQYDVYYSSPLSDTVGPVISSIDGYYNTRASQAVFKVETEDWEDTTRVLIAYTTGVDSWSSFDLTYNDATHKWSGALPGIQGAVYYVQAVDSAGNVTAVTRKGGYFNLENVDSLSVSGRNMYLPIISRQRQ